MSGTNIKELVKLIGSSVDLELIGGVTFSGVVYSVDADSGLVALRENVIGHQADYNIVNAAHIIKFSPGPGGPVSAELREHLSRKVAAVPEDTLQKFYARESDQVKRISDHVQRTIGSGVSKEAQRLFNVLSRALPCSWSQQTVVIGTPNSDGEVRIAPPYTKSTCSGKDPNSLGRVIQVLESLGVGP